MSASIRRARWQPPSLLTGYYAILVAFLFLPIGVLLLFSFNSGATLTFPLKGFTFELVRGCASRRPLRATRFGTA